MNKRAAAFLLATALLTAACSPGKTDSGSGSGPTSITVASLRVAASAPLALAQKKGFFKREGLNVSVKYVEPAAAVPSVLGGNAQFALLNAPAVLVARSNKVPIVSVSVLTVPNKDPGAYQLQLLAKRGGPIRTAKDLVGHKVAVDTLYQLPDLALRTALRSHHVDPAKVTFVEIPFPQMAQALKEGRVDAVNMTEPFATIAEKDGGLDTVLSDAEGESRIWPQSVLFSSEAYAKRDPAVVAAFQRAIKAAVVYAAAHPAEAHAIVPTYTSVPAPLAIAMRMPAWSATVPAKGWEYWAAVLRKEGVVKGDLNVSSAHRDAG